MCVCAGVCSFTAAADAVGRVQKLLKQNHINVYIESQAVPHGINEHSNDCKCLWIQVMSEQLNEQEIESTGPKRGMKSAEKVNREKDIEWVKLNGRKRQDR